MATKYDRFYRTTFSGAEERKFLPPYLQGCPETLVEKECQIEGELPTYVRGTLLRGGCGQYILETSDDGLTKPVVLQHWFDGLMMLHKFRTEDGKAYYMSKHTANGIINRVRKQGFYDSPTVGISPNQALSPIDPCLVRLGAQRIQAVSSLNTRGYQEPAVFKPKRTSSNFENQAEAIVNMFESRQPSAAETVSSFSQSQASASSSATRVEIILTPPTPIDGHVTAKHYGEDTNKEVIQLDNIIEEKEVYDKKDISDEKQVYTEDSKEVVCITQAENVKPQHADGAEKEVYHPQIAYDGVEKEVAPSHYWSAQSKHDMTEKEVYGSDKTDAQHDDPNQRRDHQQESAISEQSMETQDNEETSRVQARINNMSKAVDKRAKALSTFTTQSNTRLREGYARIGQTITDRSVAVEQGATGRLKRLEQGFSKRINRIEEGTTKRLNRLEDGFNDRVNRAGKSVDSQVASLKQNINGVKKIGSKTQKDKCNSEETKVE